MDPDVLIPLGTFITAIIGAIAVVFKVGPERTQTIVAYQGEIIEDLRQANDRCRQEAEQARSQVAQLRSYLEISQREAAELRARVIDLEKRLSYYERKRRA